MFSDQLKVIKDVTEYLSSKRELGIQAFKKLVENIKGNNPKLVVFMMMHESIESYVRYGNEFKLHEEFFGVLSNDEIEVLSRYKYDEEKVNEDFIYWGTFGICGELFEFWLCQCFHDSGVANQVDIPFYFMSEPDSEEILHLNECNKIMNKKALQQSFELSMRKNSMDSPLEI